MWYKTGPTYYYFIHIAIYVDGYVAGKPGDNVIPFDLSVCVFVVQKVENHI
jgi:hypothetical protein